MNNILLTVLSLDWIAILILVVGGFVSGFLNTVASSGSSISLPLLVYMGLPYISANATNRIPLLFGLSTATLSFQKKKLIPWHLAKKLMPSVILGTILGCLLISNMTEGQIRFILTFALIMSLVLVLTGANSFLKNKSTDGAAKLSLFAYILSFALGVWGGLIVLDIGTLCLFFLVLYLQCDMITATALKVVLILFVSIVSTLFYGIDGDINWKYGLLLAIGNIFGSYVGAKFATQNRSIKFVYAILVSIISTEVILAIVKAFRS